MKIQQLSKHTFSNGLTVFYAQVPESPSFEVAMHVNTGSRDESPENNGVSHFLEHMLFRGSRRYPSSIALAEAMEDAGGESNALTTHETTLYWLRGSVQKLQSALFTFADFFLNPVFSDLDVEKTIILQELANDYNEHSKLIDPESIAMAAMFNSHAIGLPLIGTRDVIEKLNIQHLQKKYSDFYTPHNCALVFVASCPTQQVLPLLEKYFDGIWPQASQTLQTSKSFVPRTTPSFPHKQKKPKKRPILKLQNNSDNQYSFKIMFPGFGGNCREVVIQNLLQRILDDGISSRLQGTIRERYGLVYDLSCDANAYTDFGTFSLDATISTENIDSFFEKLSDELCRIFVEPPSIQELERAKFRYNFDLDCVFDHYSKQMSREIWNHFLKQKYGVDEERQEIVSVTTQHISDMARSILSSPSAVGVLVGPSCHRFRKPMEKLFKRLEDSH